MIAKCKNPKCLYKWPTKSKMLKTTCPSCGNKVELRKKIGDKDDKN